MKRNIRLLIMGLCTVVCIVITLLLPRFPQNPSYHAFADQRSIAGIPNFFNVTSNIFFLLTGLYGFWVLYQSKAPRNIRIVYAVMFLGIFLTGIGSAYYHYAPDNNSLVFDRLPMILVFMSFLSATIIGWVHARIGSWLLVPLLATGAASVLWWHYTELQGTGDLRFYGFIQYYPMLIIPLLFWLFASVENNRGLGLLVWVIGWYAIAKVFESMDKQVYHTTGFISGHSLKHVAAGIATFYMVQFFKRKYANYTQDAGNR